MKQVVITGIGTVSPFGIGFDKFRSGLIQEKSAVSHIKAFPTYGMKCKIAGSIPDFNPEQFISSRELKRMSRVAILAIIATGEALRDAGIDLCEVDEQELEGINIILGSSAGGIDFAEHQYSYFFKNDLNRISPFAIPSSIAGMVSSEVSIYYNIKGQSHTISTGCTSSLDAIGYAFNTIRTGMANVVITGGADACITRGIISGFEKMNVITTKYNSIPHRASRPFDRNRDGFVLGEAANIFILEELNHARKRRAKIYAEIKGYAATCEAYHRVAVRTDGRQAGRAINMAIKDARISLDDVDYINMHGTSTKMNDVTETNAIKYAFNRRAYSILCSATKSYIGHPQGASGGCGLAATLVAIKSGYVHPTLNLEDPDPDCDLNYLPHTGIDKEINNAIVNCLGFGSKNSAIVVSRFK